MGPKKGAVPASLTTPTSERFPDAPDYLFSRPFPRRIAVLVSQMRYVLMGTLRMWRANTPHFGHQPFQTLPFLIVVVASVF